MNLEQLHDLLSQYSVSTEDWGSGKAKTSASLLEEITSGECQLFVEEGQLIRHLEVAAGFLFYFLPGDKLIRLREAYQEFLEPKRIRPRDHEASVSEKVKKNEDPQRGMERAIRREELHLEGLVQMTYAGASLRREFSPSFPTLLTEYKTYRFFLIMQDPSDYKPEGYIEDQSQKEHDPKRVYFEWRDA